MKMVMVGDTQVGKTCLARGIVTGQFQTGSLPTIGAAFQNHIISMSKGPVTLQIWDTARQEKYRALTPMYYHNAQAAVLVFDLTSLETFRALEEWTADLEATPGLRKIFLVGNKLDLADERQVTAETAKHWAQVHGALDYFETSAKLGDGVVNLFTTVAEAITLGPTATDNHRPEPETNASKCKC
jgi:small GTP-binding protein